MAHVVRPLIQWPRWRHRHSTVPRLLGHLHSSSTNIPFLAFLSTRYYAVDFRSRALKPGDVPVPSEFSPSDDESSDSSETTKKSRNERKRDARRAVRWGMELAGFSPSQIKRILRVASLEQEVFDAIMLVKKLGRDVREGKRRQFNYIGGLLREVEPKIMDGLIKATKDGDESKFIELLGTKMVVVDDDPEEGEEEEEIADELEEEDPMHISVVNRWYDGLISKDIGITNEIYSLREVEFDRQELRLLVRKVHSTQENKSSSHDNGKPDGAAAKARRGLTHFLLDLAKQIPTE